MSLLLSPFHSQRTNVYTHIHKHTLTSTVHSSITSFCVYKSFNLRIYNNEETSSSIHFLFCQSPLHKTRLPLLPPYPTWAATLHSWPLPLLAPVQTPSSQLSVSESFSGAFLIAQSAKNLPAMQGTQV